jgi:DNA-binding CsgD family transcriptional regulator
MPIDRHVPPDELIGAIYENLTSDDPWGIALQKTQRMLSASDIMIRISHKGTKPRDSIFAYGPSGIGSNIADWEEQYSRKAFPPSQPLGKVTFINWDDVTQNNDRGVYVIEYVREREIVSTMVHCFDAIDSIECLITAARRHPQNPFNQEDSEFLVRIGRHFRNAVRLRRDVLRIKVMSEFQAEGLNRMGVGGILVDQDGSMILLNEVAKNVVAQEDGLKFCNALIHAIDDHDDKRLQANIREVLGSEERPQTRAMTVSRRSGRRDLGLVISGRRSMSLISGKPETNALIFIRDTDSMTELDAGLVQQLFHLTRAEASLAVGLAKGKSLEDIETEFNIRHNTARAHLRSIFLKANVHKRSELVHLLINCVAPLGQTRGI